MLFVSLFLFELFILYLLSRKVINVLWHILNRVTRNKKITVYLLAFLFLPGTFLHEFAHWLAAKLLFVHTGRMSLWPQANDNNIKFGSVLIAKSDPVRRLFIGISPVLLGLTLIMTILYMTFNSDTFNNKWWAIIIAYTIFDIGNTMFSSKKDMEGTMEFVLTIITITIICYIFGLRMPISEITSFLNQHTITNSFQKGTLYLLTPIIIDSIIIIISKILKR